MARFTTPNGSKGVTTKLVGSSRSSNSKTYSEVIAPAVGETVRLRVQGDDPSTAVEDNLLSLWMLPALLLTFGVIGVAIGRG